MSVSFYDLMKYAKTGIASPDMTGFDKLRAKAAFGGYPVSTITGVPPISFKADGTPLTAWSIAGNMTQTGTPTPDAPIMPNFCGVRTGNLFDKNKTPSQIYVTESVQRLGIEIPLIAGTYTASGGMGTSYAKTKINGVYGEAISLNYARQFTLDSDGYILVYASTQEFYDDAKNTIMLNTGTAPPPYEPYGWVEKITCAGQTVPVYLGQVQTVRRIKKLVLTGEETIGYSGNNNAPYKIIVSDIIQVSDRYAILFVCSHYRAVSNAASWASYPSCVTWSFFDGKNLQALNFRDPACADAYAFKAYLAQQYAAGNPVTVWYVLAEPETAIVNEPLAKIGDYADELSSTDAGVTIPTAKGANVLTVDTDLQPSSVSVTGNIKPS